MKKLNYLYLLSAMAATGLSSTASAQLAGTPTIASYHSLGMCLDVRATDSNVLLWGCHGGANQAFRFQNGNYGQIILPNGTCLTGATSAGSVVTAQACRGSQAQKWGFQPNGTLRNETGFCADIERGGRTAGTRIVSWTCTGSTNQQWYPSLTTRSVLVGIAEASRVGTTRPKAFLSAQGFSGSNMVAAGGGNMVAAGGGNLVGNDGASIVLGGTGGIIAARGSYMVAAGGGNMVAAGGGNVVPTNACNLVPSNYNFFSGNTAGAFRQ